MNHRPFTPIACAIALIGCAAAGGSHWWSVRQMVANSDFTRLVRQPVAPITPPETTAAPASVPVVEKPTLPTLTEAAPATSQQEFYQELLREMQQLRTENRDLLNQIAETNRDLMKLEFRVDTHSQQFRPMPVSEERNDISFGTGFDDSPGLLPPRAEPVDSFYAE